MSPRAVIIIATVIVENADGAVGGRQSIGFQSALPSGHAGSCCRRGRHPCWSALRILTLIGITIMSSSTPTRSQDGSDAASAKLGETAQKVLVDIFRKRDVTVVDRYFVEPFVQHDPNIADGLSGMKAFASEVAKSQLHRYNHLSHAG